MPSGNAFPISQDIGSWVVLICRFSECGPILPADGCVSRPCRGSASPAELHLWAQSNTMQVRPSIKQPATFWGAPFVPGQSSYNRSLTGMGENGVKKRAHRK